MQLCRVMFRYPLPSGAADHAPITRRFGVLVAALTGTAEVSLNAAALSRRAWKRWRYATTMLAAVSLLAAGAPRAVADQAPAFHEDTCREMTALVLVPASRTRPYVPTHYRLLSFGSGLTGVTVEARRCERQDLNGQTETSVQANMAVAISDPEATPRDHGTFDQYELFWAASTPDLVAWLGPNAADVSTSTSQVLLDPGLAWSSRPIFGLAEPSFSFAAPAPLTSPFTLDAVVSDANPLPANLLSTDVWLDDQHGTETISVTVAQLRPSAAIGTLDITPGSEMAKILGSDHLLLPMAVLDETAPEYTKRACTWPPAASQQWHASCGGAAPGATPASTQLPGFANRRRQTHHRTHTVRRHPRRTQRHHRRGRPDPPSRA